MEEDKVRQTENVLQWKDTSDRQTRTESYKGFSNVASILVSKQA